MISLLQHQNRYHHEQVRKLTIFHPYTCSKDGDDSDSQRNDLTCEFGYGGFELWSWDMWWCGKARNATLGWAWVMKTEVYHRVRVKGRRWWGWWCLRQEHPSEVGFYWLHTPTKSYVRCLSCIVIVCRGNKDTGEKEGRPKTGEMARIRKSEGKIRSGMK